MLFRSDHPEVPVLFIMNNKHNSISVRSSEKNHPELNCRDIAVMYGGGGHKNAAGFPTDPNTGLVYRVAFSNEYIHNKSVYDEIAYTPDPILDDDDD